MVCSETVPVAGPDGAGAWIPALTNQEQEIKARRNQDVAHFPFIRKSPETLSFPSHCAAISCFNITTKERKSKVLGVCLVTQQVTKPAERNARKHRWDSLIRQKSLD